MKKVIVLYVLAIILIGLAVFQGLSLGGILREPIISGWIGGLAPVVLSAISIFVFSAASDEQDIYDHYHG